MTPRDMLRLQRAVWLDVERIGNGSWHVTGGSALRVVTPDGDSCSCDDHRIRGGKCKHRLAVALACGDAETVRALRSLIPAPRKQNAPPNDQRSVQHRRYRGTAA